MNDEKKRDWCARRTRRGRRATALAMALVSAGCSGTSPDESSEAIGAIDSAILDGTTVNPSAYPAVGMVWAATGTPNEYKTGTGTLFGSRYVLTAAHVVRPQWGVYPPNVFVYFDNGNGKVKYMAETVFIHPSYLQYTNTPYLNKLWDGFNKEGVFDVAVLILSEVPAGITPVPLSAVVPAPPSAVSFLGYGMVATGGAVPADNTTQSLYRGTNTIDSANETYVRTKYQPGTSGTYKGDSGGPLLLGSSLAGVTTSVSGYGYGSEDTFTRVGTIQPWIMGLLPGSNGQFTTDYYENVEETRPPFALNSMGHYSEPRTFGGGLDEDKISFRLDSASHVRISAPHHFDWTTPDPSVTLTKNGTAVPLDQPNTALYEGDLAAGTYVATIKNNYSRGLSYTLGISTDGWFVQGDPFEPDGPYRYIQFPLGYVSNHNILPRNDQDYVAFEIGTRSNVRIETLPLSGNPDNDRSADTVITLMTSGGTELETNDDRPNSYCSLIERTLDPGRYIVKVAGYMGNQVSYYGIRTTTF